MLTPLLHTKDGLELQLGTNHFGHFLLTSELLPLIITTPKSRIINISSKAQSHTKIGIDFQKFKLNDPSQYKSTEAYMQSKFANVIFTNELQERLKQAGSKTLTFSVHPGVVLTELTRYINPILVTALYPIGWLLMKSPYDGSHTSIYAAIAPELENHGGAFLSDCAISQQNPLAADKGISKRLWEESEKITNTTFLNLVSKLK